MGDAAGDMRRTQAFRQHADAAHPVLERHDQGVGPQKRLALVGAGFRVPQLDREQHRVDRADLGRVVGHGDVLQMQVAFVAGDPQAALADGLQMGAARQEVNVMTGGGQTGAEVSADTAGGHDGYAHLLTCL